MLGRVLKTLHHKIIRLSQIFIVGLDSSQNRPQAILKSIFFCEEIDNHLNENPKYKVLEKNKTHIFAWNTQYRESGPIGIPFELALQVFSQRLFVQISSDWST